MKKKYKPYIQKENNFLKIFGTLIVLSISLLAFLSVQSVSSGLFGNKIEEKKTITTIIDGKEVKQEITVQKQIPETVTVLLVGRGGLGNDAPELTDTIILAKLNKKTKEIALLSVPRDLYVQYKKTNGLKRRSKINAIYANNLQGAGTEAAAMKVLIKKMEDITGEKIDYFANVDFNGFTELIDTIGGIEIDVPKRLVDSKYPTKNWGWETIVFEKGKQIMTGEDALKYARSRKSTSDYDRSLRQQLVIKAIKDKIASTYIVSSPEKIIDLYNVFDKNIFTNLSPIDAVNLVLGIDFFNADFKFYSSNIHDGCYPGAETCEKGGIVYPPTKEAFGGQSVALFDDATPTNISVYTLSKKYANVVLNYPKIQEEKLKINIINATDYTGQSYKFLYKVKRYGFVIDQQDFATAPDKPLKDSVIYYNEAAENSETLMALKTFFSGTFEKVDTVQFPIKKRGRSIKTPVAPNIEIVIGNDYIKDTSIFTF